MMKIKRGIQQFAICLATFNRAPFSLLSTSAGRQLSLHTFPNPLNSAAAPENSGHCHGQVTALPLVLEQLRWQQRTVEERSDLYLPKLHFIDKNKTPLKNLQLAGLRLLLLTKLLMGLLNTELFLVGWNKPTQKLGGKTFNTVFP